MILSWPNNDFRQEFVDATVSAIGRAVDFVYISGLSPCPACSLDPINNTSTDSFCPVCDGVYWIPQSGVVTISGHVTWKYLDKLGWVTGGQQFEGDCQVKVPFKGIIVDIVDSVTNVIVDHKVMQIMRSDLRGSPTINRVIFSLKEKEKDD